MSRFGSKLYLPILIAVFLLSSLVRLFKLDSAPSGMLIDEPAFGYNAYSILKTGRDEHNQFLPLIFKSYGDDKLPVNVYALVPSIALLGLTHFAVRVPGALASIGFSFVFYVLLKQLKFSQLTIVSTTLIASLSSWTFFISRFTRESSFGILFITLALSFLVKSLQKPQTKKLLILAAGFFALTWYTYIAYRFATLIFILTLLLFLYPKKYITSKQLSTFICALIIFTIPTFFISSTGAGTARLTQLGFAADPGPVMEITEKRNFCALSSPLFLCSLFFNKGTVYSRIIAERYFQIFSPEFLFTKGIPDLQIFNLPNFGQFPLATALVFYIGIAILVYKLFTKQINATQLIIFIGLSTTVIPAVFAGEFQPMRLSPALPFFLLTIAVGIETILNSVPKYRVGLTAVFSGAILAQSLLFYFEFFTVHVNKFDQLYNSQHRELMLFLNSQPKTTQIFFHPYTADPIIYFAFYNHIEPTQYQKGVVWDKTEEKGYLHAKKFQNIEITRTSAEELACKTNNEAVIVTDHTIADVQPKFKAKSKNGVYTYAWVYNLSQVKQASKCIK